MSYQTEYDRSMKDPAGFWRKQAEALEWFKFPQQILSLDDDGLGYWFADGEMNTAYMALDHHVKAGRGNQLALIYDSPVTNTKSRYTYAELTDVVARTAGMVADLGVVKGDRVIIYMPMIPEAVIAMLACARIGAIHSVVFGGFAAHELAGRIEDATPKVIVSASCGVEPGRLIPYKPLLDEAVRTAGHTPQRCIIVHRHQVEADMIPGQDIWWEDAMAAATPADCVAVAATDPLYILYTSGTTGHPKGIVRDNGGHAVALAWSMRNIYGVKPDEVFWTASDVGWVCLLYTSPSPR